MACGLPRPRAAATRPLPPIGPAMHPRSTKVVTALLAALTAVPPVTINLYLPSLPSMVTDLGTTVAMVQLTVTSFFFAFAAGQLLYGPLSDRFGRRPLLIGSLFVYMVGGVGCALAPSVEFLVAARLVQAVGACGAPVMARAVVVDLFGREQDRKSTRLNSSH